MKLTVNVDGGARGNPGPAGIAAVATGEDGEILAERNEVIGETTNNVAEYRAMLLGIELAGELGADEVELIGDSELIVKQVRGSTRSSRSTCGRSAPRSWRRCRASARGRSATFRARRTHAPTSSSTRRWTASALRNGRPGPPYTHALVRL